MPALLNLIEDEAMRKSLLRPTPLRMALDKVLANYAEEARKHCADAMTSVPRQFELAADYAARAEAYGNLLERLIRDIDKFTPSDQPPDD